METRSEERVILRRPRAVPRDVLVLMEMCFEERVICRGECVVHGSDYAGFNGDALRRARDPEKVDVVRWDVLASMETRSEERVIVVDDRVRDLDSVRFNGDALRRARDPGNERQVSHRPVRGFNGDALRRARDHEATR